MAGTTHYTYYFKSISGATWLVSILDTTYGGTDETDLHPDSDGFSINWEGPSEETYQPIISSTLSFNVYRDVNSRSLLDSIIEGPARRFIVEVYKLGDSGYIVMWRGYLLQDSMRKPDMPDNTDLIKFSAADGFGLLKYLFYESFNGDITDNLSRKSVLDWFTLILGYMPLHFAGETDVVLRTAMSWHEDSNSYAIAFDPLTSILISDAAFVEVDKYNISSVLSYYDILTAILIPFNLQISQWNGCYLIIDQNCYGDGTAIEWKYTKDGTYIDSEYKTVYGTRPKTLAGGSYGYILPANEVNCEYTFKQTVFKSNLLPLISYENTLYSLGTFERGIVINLVGSIDTNAVCSDVDFVFNLHYTLTVMNAGTYLKKISVAGSPDYYLWISTPTVIDLWSETFSIHDNPSTYEFTASIPIDITLPATLGTDEEVTLIYKFIEYTGYSGSTLYVNPMGSQIVSSISITDTNGTMEGSQKFIVKKTAASEAAIKTLDTAIIGDSPFKFSAGALFIVDSTGTIQKSDNWRFYSSETAMPLHSLRCREMLALIRNTVQTYSGNFSGIPNFHMGYSYDSKKWCWLSINWYANSEQYSGTAMAVILDRTGLTVDTPLTTQDG